MRTVNRVLLASSSVILAGLWAAPALAQKDTQPKLPNVLLLVDSSGSLEYLLDYGAKLPGDPSAPNTACDGSTSRTQRNRWTNLVTAMTGSIADTDFSCRAVQRSGTNFLAEFALDGARPYDYGYYLPFNRIYSNNCAYGAGTVKHDWKWAKLPSDDGGKDYTYRDTSGNAVSSCQFIQANDGLLDGFRSLVRFGFMAEDTLADPGTGSDGSTNLNDAKADDVNGNKGMWSYYHDWISGPPTGQPSSPVPSTTSASGAQVDTTRPAAGNPAGCSTPAWMEVGARNQAAPPWEGRLVPFGDPNSDTGVITTNDQIQMQLLTMRPYGASPLAGLLDDAEEFLFHDTTLVPGKTYRYGPSDDPYWINGCRKTFVLLLSDGQPNMDLRSPGGGVAGCDSAPIGGIKGVCPYDTPDAIANHMRVAPPANQSVVTFVVGFTRSEFSDMNPVPSVPSGAMRCEDLQVASGGTDCVNPPPQLAACCNLQKIAVAGGTTHAYFADTQNKLKQAMAAILSQIVAGTTDRTWPVYAPGGNRLAMGSSFNPSNPTAAYQFAASFAVNAAGQSAPKSVGGLIPSLWNGRLKRERTSCPQATNTPTVQPSTAATGDDYAYNLDMADDSHPRRFFTAIGEADGSKIDSEITMRPYITTDDGLGTYKTSTSAPSSPLVSSTFVTQMTSYPAAFGMPADGPCKSAFGDPISPAQCTTDIVQWEIGLNNTLPSKVPFLTRDWKKCPITCVSGPSSPSNACACSQFGAVFHSTPVVVGPPREFLRDESYITYQNTAAVAKQPTVLYTATMDGQLHAFKVQANDSTDSDKIDDQPVNNEMWSFFPPAVLKNLLPNYNTGGVPLLDGQVVIADVPGTLYTSAQAPLLERKGNDPVTWHRVLLGGGGAAGGFYYALDITDPANPRFLWQLSRDAQGNPLFGLNTPTPAIALVNILVNGDTRQVPVAIMPGGATGAKEDKCHKNDTTTSPYAASYSNVLLNDGTNPHLLNGVTASPPLLQCWKKVKDNVASTGNSLVVARLDTGKVLGFFLGDSYSGAPKYGDGGDDGEGGDSKPDKHAHFTNVFDAPFQGPVTGVPVVYPGQTGQVSDRVYVGDADGLLWRLDMSNPDISKWKVELAWDSYVKETETPDKDTSLRESIGVVPIVSRDAIGNPVILVATGDQDQFNSQPTTNHVWSLTENPLTKKVSPNWHIAMGKRGARTTGPMTLFNGSLYFASFIARNPASSNVCDEGYGSVWAVDFVRRGAGSSSSIVPAATTRDATDWPLPAFPSNTIGVYHWGQDGAPGTIIMGVSTSETPTCDAQVAVSDPYFGNHTALSGVSGSSYRVSWQTGAGAGLSGGAVQNNGNGVQSVTPPTPGGATRIDSWASIVE